MAVKEKQRNISHHLKCFIRTREIVQKANVYNLAYWRPRFNPLPPTGVAPKPKLKCFKGAKGGAETAQWQSVFLASRRLMV